MGETIKTSHSALLPWQITSTAALNGYYSTLIVRNESRGMKEHLLLSKSKARQLSVTKYNTALNIANIECLDAIESNSQFNKGFL